MLEKVDLLQTEVCNSSGIDIQFRKNEQIKEQLKDICDPSNKDIQFRKNEQIKEQLKDICNSSDKGQLGQVDSFLTKGWKSFQKTLYYFSADARNWADSRHFCQKNGSDLVMIDNAEEQLFAYLYSLPQCCY
ncbi:C-type lectin domain family 4 member E-like [Protopterus annectens]|uniref:C-type lectin domain family 4 member E-like n=1 Tax=Protopterus annectens TaxID=7888 RepID=UPI001CF9CE6C|nr:C-type lectin domain family 4 member E-like [Protopterus annectens]